MPEAALSDDRARTRRAFLADHGLPTEGWRALAADASARRYFRPAEPSAAGWLLMDSPPGVDPIILFLAVAGHLGELGFSAPRVLAADRARGLALIEDFGDDTFTRRIAAGADEGALYRLAVDTLAALHEHPDATAIGLPAYGIADLLEEAALFVDWYLPATAVGPVDALDRAAILNGLAGLVGETAARRDALVLRDFHVDNLMIVPGRSGVAACGLLDFQDARLGSPAYDLMSLLEDARRDVPPPLAAALIERYRASRPTLDPAAFARDYALLAAQRHLKVAGIFVRLARRDGKPGYLRHIPRVLRLLDRALAAPGLAPLRRLLDTRAAGWRAGLSAAVHPA